MNQPTLRDMDEARMAQYQTGSYDPRMDARQAFELQTQNRLAQMQARGATERELMMAQVEAQKMAIDRFIPVEQREVAKQKLDMEARYGAQMLDARERGASPQELQQLSGELQQKLMAERDQFARSGGNGFDPAGQPEMAKKREMERQIATQAGQPQTLAQIDAARAQEAGQAVSPGWLAKERSFTPGSRSDPNIGSLVPGMGPEVGGGRRVAPEVLETQSRMRPDSFDRPQPAPQPAQNTMTAGPQPMARPTRPGVVAQPEAQPQGNLDTMMARQRLTQRPSLSTPQRRTADSGGQTLGDMDRFRAEQAQAGNPMNDLQGFGGQQGRPFGGQSDPWGQQGGRQQDYGPQPMDWGQGYGQPQRAPMNWNRPDPWGGQQTRQQGGFGGDPWGGPGDRQPGYGADPWSRQGGNQSPWGQQQSPWGQQQSPWGPPHGGRRQGGPWGGSSGGAWGGNAWGGGQGRRNPWGGGSRGGSWGGQGGFGGW